jgi:hypothetical protein
MNNRWRSPLAALVMGLAATWAACGSSGGADHSNPVPDGGTNGAVDGSSSGANPPVLNEGDAAPAGTLAISPSAATLTVTNATPQPSQPFTATVTVGSASTTVTPTWSLGDFTIGTIDASGLLTPRGTVAGTIQVTASYGGATATATATVLVNISTNLSNTTLPDGTVITQDAGAITPPDMTALTGAPAGDAGTTPPTLVYPYDQTVFPLGLLAPVAEFGTGPAGAVDFKVSLDTTDFHWDGFGSAGSAASAGADGAQAAIPQSAWDAALQTAALVNPPPKVTLSLVSAVGGVAYGPAQSQLVVANGKLTGVIYFESYSSDTIPPDNIGATSDFGLWAVKPGLTAPPSHLQAGCVICHSVAASGNTLTNGTDDNSIGSSTGLFQVETDGGYLQLATPPTALPTTGGGGGPDDSRGMGWSTVSPDGTVVLRSVGDFWGGQTLLGWATPSEPLMSAGALAPLSTSITINGGFYMFVPQYSVDGQHLVYVNATNPAGVGSVGTPEYSIGMVDVATALLDGGADDAGFGTVTLTNPRTLYDSTTSDAGGANAATKVPTFLPDSQSVVFEETLAPAYATFNYMLPDYGGVDGELATLQGTSGGSYVRVALANANAGHDPKAPTVNYEPKPLPVSVGGYYWVVFASLRQDAYPNVTSPKKLWVAAITPGTTPGIDPSHPPFTLVNQAIVANQQSQRAFWALAPCLGVGASCATGSDCCNGSCIPESSTDPSSPLECLPPATAACVPLGGQCAAGQNQDCCNAAQGITCIGTLNGFGTCQPPAPK